MRRPAYRYKQVAKACADRPMYISIYELQRRADRPIHRTPTSRTGASVSADRGPTRGAAKRAGGSRLRVPASTHSDAGAAGQR